MPIVNFDLQLSAAELQALLEAHNAADIPQLQQILQEQMRRRAEAAIEMQVQQEIDILIQYYRESPETERKKIWDIIPPGKKPK